MKIKREIKKIMKTMKMMMKMIKIIFIRMKMETQSILKT
jgi:hypothetical protein